MDIDPLSSSSKHTASSAGKEATWQVGQLVKATTLTAAQGGQTQLQIGRQIFQAQLPEALTRAMPASLHAGAALKLEVMKLEPIPLLRVLQPALAVNADQQLLRQLLPKQAPLPPLLANLHYLNHTPLKELPVAVAQQARALVQHLATPENLKDPQRLAQAIRDSGIFLESKLARGGELAASLQRDFKANLLRFQESIQQALRLSGDGLKTQDSPLLPRRVLARQLSEWLNQALLPRQSHAATKPLAAAGILLRAPNGNVFPAVTTQAARALADALIFATPMRERPLLPQPRVAASMAQLTQLTQMLTLLGKQTESALARIGLQQTQSQAGETDNKQVWLLELPVKRDQGVDTFHIKIEHRREGHKENHDAQEKSLWVIRVAFDLDGLGPVQARVTTRDDKVAALFWLEQEPTTLLFRQHLRVLEESLQRAGLEVELLRCITGAAPDEDEQHPDPPPRQGGILNERV